MRQEVEEREEPAPAPRLSIRASDCHDLGSFDLEAGQLLLHLRLPNLHKFLFWATLTGRPTVKGISGNLVPSATESPHRLMERSPRHTVNCQRWEKSDKIVLRNCGKILVP